MNEPLGRAPAPPDSEVLRQAHGLVRRAVRGMAAYAPGLQPTPGERLVKLNTNENPFPPSPKVIEALHAAVDGRLRLYPDPLSRQLRSRAAELYGLPSEDWVLAGNGSDEVLAILMRTFVDEGDTVAWFQPSYSLYPVLAAAARARTVEIPLGREAAGVQVPAPRAKLLFLTTPNAPYGLGFPTSWIAQLLDAFPGIVVADEAYVDFAPESCLSLLEAHPRLVIARSLSKAYALAGMRVGLACAHPPLVAEMMKVKDSYNLSRLAQMAASAALADQEYFRATVKGILATRASFQARLASLGFTVLASQANFLFVVPPLAAAEGAAQPTGRRSVRSARPLYDRLLARGFLVRHFDRPGLDDGLRISIGEERDMEALADALAEETKRGPGG